MLGIFIVAGCVMETTPNIVILAPIMLPLAENIGMDDIHFCIFMVTALGVGFVTPPLGLNLFVLAGLTGESVMAIALRAVPYVIVLLDGVLLLAFIPALSLLDRKSVVSGTSVSVRVYLGGLRLKKKKKTLTSRRD